MFCYVGDRQFDYLVQLEAGQKPLQINVFSISVRDQPGQRGELEAVHQEVAVQAGLRTDLSAADDLLDQGGDFEVQLGHDN